MGKMTLIIVFSVIIISGLTFVSIRETNANSADNSADYAKETINNYDCTGLIETALNKYLKGEIGLQQPIEKGNSVAEIEQVNSTTLYDTVRIVANSPSGKVEAIVSLYNTSISLPS